MIILRVDDVGRKHTDPPENGSDNDLAYFERWRDKLGLAGLPVVYGVVPAWISSFGVRWLSRNLTGEESLAIHGFNHRPGAVVTESQMKYGRSLFDAKSYIPPFNKYDSLTIRNWYSSGGTYFFGGNPAEHHSHGDRPVFVENVVHLSAYWSLYGKAAELLRALPTVTESLPEYPIVATLHVPWDNSSLNEAAELVNQLRPYLVSVRKVLEYVGANHGS